MNKLFFWFIALSFLIFPKSTHAALLDISQTGQVTLNVLAATSEGLTVKKVANANFNTNHSKIELTNTDGKFELNLESPSGTKSLDVTNLDQNIVEIEKYISPQTIKIKLNNNQFEIDQSGTIASTSFPIEVNTIDKQILVKSSSGYQFLKTLPLDVVNSLALLGVMDSPNHIEISQDDSGELIYIGSGEKIINIFNIYDLKIPVTANVSALTGKIKQIDGPIWYKIFGFLLV